MKKSNMKHNVFVAILAILCLVFGSVAGHFAFPKTIEKEVIVISDPIEKIVEVEKIVEIQKPSELELAVSEFMKAVEEEEDEAGNDIDVLGNYDINELVIKKIADEYVVSYEDEDKFSVEFSIDLKFKESGEKSEVESYDVKVTFEEGEDTIVEVL